MQEGFVLSALIITTALVFMAASLYTDVRTQRIPNLLTVPFACGGILFHCATTGFIEGGLYAVTGLSLGCLLLAIPFALGGMGGGDVKCLGTVGAWMGPDRIFWIFLYGAMAGGVLALFLLVRPSHGEGVRGLLFRVKSGLITGRFSRSSTKGMRFPYTIPITVGFIVFLLIGKAAP
jgi:prepilin peptidase CpaA